MGAITISSISIKNYRNVGECNINFSRYAAGIVGVNAAGKTNVGRGILFFFNILQSHSAPVGVQSGKKFTDESPVSDLIWNPLEVDHHAVLATPEPGQTIEFAVTASVAEYLLPNNHGFVLRQLERGKAHYDLSVRIDVLCKNQPNGDARLVPSFVFTLDGKELVRGDIVALQPMWKLFTGARIQALQSAGETLNALKQLQQKSAHGQRAFDRLNRLIHDIDPNFAPISFISSGPIAIEGDISDLVPDNMSSGNLKAFQLLSAARNPEHEKVAFLHIEEPEAHFHPTVQRAVVRELLRSCREAGLATLIESHSPHVIAEMYHEDCPVYRLEVQTQDTKTRIRRSSAKLLSDRTQVEAFMEEIGYDGAFAVLGGAVVIVDGVSDVPVYRHFLGLFEDIDHDAVIFLPLGQLESGRLSMTDVSRIARAVAVVADGHFDATEQGQRLQEKCQESGVTYIALKRLGVENFHSLDALRKLSTVVKTVKIADDAFLEPMKSLSNTPGIDNFSKKHHNIIAAQFATRENLAMQEDFMQLVKFLRDAGIQQHIGKVSS